MMNMKNGLWTAGLLMIAGMAAATPRDTLLLREGWLFGRSRDAVSEAVRLPHDFQISQPWVAPAKDEKASFGDEASNVKSRLSPRGFKEMGEGWYRYELVPERSWKQKRVVLDFEGIMLVGDVWLNGEHIGKTDYGYLGFGIDISDKLKYDSKNEILVCASTMGAENSRWYTGGGLFRDVRIITSDADLYFPRHPLYITTRDNRTVSVQAEIICRLKTPVIRYGLRILDNDGICVAETIGDLKFNAKWRDREYPLASVDVADARLWSCDTPYLYTAEVTLYDAEGNVHDQTRERFGIRTVEFSPAFGLKLNGKKVLLKGWANHHTLGALGAANYPRAIAKRIDLMKSFGFNHVRTSHNPYSEAFLRLCDEKGLLVVDELYDKWLQKFAGGRTDWKNLWQYDVPEFVRRDRNHPSVVLWSLGNELQTYADLPFNDWGVTAFELQKKLLQRYDTSRLVTVAMHPRGRNLETDTLPADLVYHTDVAAYNYRYMYFPGDGRNFPHMMFYQSEANMSNLGPNFFDMDLDRVIGLAYWGAIDYLGESNGWPAKGWVQGFYDISLQPKPTAWFVKSFFRDDEPMVHIAVQAGERQQFIWNGVDQGNVEQSESWNWATGDSLKVVCYTNAGEVELFLNGKSLGTRTNNVGDSRQRNRPEWQVAYAAGNLVAVARTGGREVARDRIETAGEARKLTLSPDNNAWKADGLDLQHIRILAVDSKGRRVWNVGSQLHFQVEGPAEIVGLDNGNNYTDELAVGNSHKMYRGSALVILRSTGQAGKVTLSVSSGDFKTQKLMLTTR